MHINRCNDTRGWFPSNYVKLIEDIQPESDDEVVNRKRVLRFLITCKLIFSL